MSVPSGGTWRLLNAEAGYWYDQFIDRALGMSVGNMVKGET